MIDLHIDPAVVRVLHDAARVLGRPYRGRSTRHLTGATLGLDDRITLFDCDLPKAQRHFLLATREEVAFFLRQAFVARLQDDPRGKAFVVRRPRPGECLPTMTPSEIAAGGTAHARELAPLESTPLGLDALATADLCSIAVLAYRLVPEDKARIYAALAKRASDQPHAALRIVQDLIRSGCPRELQPHAWETAGSAFMGIGAFDRACKCYRRAAVFGADRISAAVFWVAGAALSGADEECLRAAAHCEELTASQGDSFREILRQIPMLRAGGWKQLPLRRGVALERIKDKASEAGRQVLDACWN